MNYVMLCRVLRKKTRLDEAGHCHRYRLSIRLPWRGILSCFLRIQWPWYSSRSFDSPSFFLTLIQYHLVLGLLVHTDHNFSIFQECGLACIGPWVVIFQFFS